MNTRIFVTFLLLLATLGSTTTLCAQRNRGGRTAATHQGPAPGCDIDSILELFHSQPVEATRQFEQCFGSQDNGYFLAIFKARKFFDVRNTDSVRHYLSVAEIASPILETSHIAMRIVVSIEDSNYTQLAYWSTILKERIPAELHANRQSLEMTYAYSQMLLALHNNDLANGAIWGERGIASILLLPNQYQNRRNKYLAEFYTKLVEIEARRGNYAAVLKWANLGVGLEQEAEMRYFQYFRVLAATDTQNEDTITHYCLQTPEIIMALDSILCFQCVHIVLYKKHLNAEVYGEMVNRLYPNNRSTFFVNLEIGIQKNDKDLIVNSTEAILNSAGPPLDSLNTTLLLYANMGVNHTQAEIVALMEKITSHGGQFTGFMQAYYYYLKAGILGVQGNLAESCRYLRMAAEMGNPEAITALRQSCN